ncbi:MAG: TorF family putative porin [Betaproteobacteria bacterium]|nr:TorF family putative porin [Betaproteobacteria bacterium]
MRKTIIAASVAAALTIPALAAADAPQPPYTLTANVSLVTDYRFRGITQTFGEPAIQGGADFSHSSGFYLGNWDSNVSETAGYPGGNLEMDFYGGWRHSWGDWGIDAGLYYYYYPGSNAAGGGSLGPLVNPHSTALNSGTVHNTEGYIAGSWKFLSLKYSRAFSDYFMVPDTKGTGYLDLSATYDLGGGWGVNGHVGHLTVHNFGEASYTDYRLGVTKDLGSGWTAGASLITTNAKDDCGAAASGSIEPYCFAKLDGTGVKTYNGGKGTVVLSIGRTF